MQKWKVGATRSHRAGPVGRPASCTLLAHAHLLRRGGRGNATPAAPAPATEMTAASRDDLVELRPLLIREGEGHRRGGVRDRLGTARAGDRDDMVAEPDLPGEDHLLRAHAMRLCDPG